MLQDHVNTRGQDDPYDAGFQPAQDSLYIRILQQFFQQNHNQQNNDKRRQDNRSRRNQRASEASLRAAHIGGQIHHDRARGTLADRDHIRQHFVLYPAV